MDLNLNKNTMANLVNGLFVKRSEKAPDFLKVSLSFNDKFLDWLKENFNSNGWCNVDIMESKDGKLYAKLNDWKPKTEGVDIADLGEEVTETDTSRIPF